jgi:hypothetical protein
MSRVNGGIAVIANWRLVSQHGTKTINWTVCRTFWFEASADESCNVCLQSIPAYISPAWYGSFQPSFRVRVLTNENLQWVFSGPPAFQYIKPTRGSVICWGTVLQAGRSPVWDPMRWIFFSTYVIFPAALVLIEMSTWSRKIVCGE